MIGCELGGYAEAKVEASAFNFFQGCPYLFDSESEYSDITTDWQDLWCYRKNRI